MSGKTNSLRTYYSNQLKKFSDNKKSRAGLDDTFELKWAHFFETNLISFLQTNLIVETSNLMLQFVRNEHKCRQKFEDTLNPLCSCSLETESTAYFFPRCRNCTIIRITFMNELNDIYNSITSRQPNELLRTILYGNCKFKDNVNKVNLIATIQFIKNSNKFNQSLI